MCVNKLTIIGSDNGLSPGLRQAMILTNAAIFSIRTVGTNVSEIWSEIHTSSFKKMLSEMWSAKWRQFVFVLNVLTSFCIWSPVAPLGRFMPQYYSWRKNRPIQIYVVGQGQHITHTW